MSQSKNLKLNQGETKGKNVHLKYIMEGGIV